MRNLPRYVMRPCFGMRVAIWAQVACLPNYLFGKVNLTGPSSTSPLSCPTKRHRHLVDREQDCPTRKLAKCIKYACLDYNVKIDFYVFPLMYIKHWQRTPQHQNEDMEEELTVSVLHLTTIVFATVQSIIQMWPWVIKIKFKKIQHLIFL